MNVSVNTLTGYKHQMPSTGTPIFYNWVEVEKDYLFRSSAPYYDETAINPDASQKMTRRAANFLSQQGVTTLISVNHYRLSDAEIQILTNASIYYMHYPVEDFHPPNAGSLRSSVNEILASTGATLVYCGYGQGRTGTVITAWEILTGQKDVERAIQDSTAETAGQEAELRKLIPAEFKNTYRLDQPNHGEF